MRVMRNLVVGRGALACALLLAVMAPAGAAPKSTPPQASLSLQNENAELCLRNNTSWTLTKTADATAVATGDTVVWTIAATRGATSDDMLAVNGFVSVYNSGAGAATIGNVVVNLQRRRSVGTGTKWVSASANVADATSGDGATWANIVAAASQENPGWNAAWNSPATYAVSGAMGTFQENAGSGSVEFTDADSNAVWAITPQQAIPAGMTVDLLFRATFNSTVLGIAEGEQVRAEVIVSFGNSGARAGSGASAANIDINGNGAVDADEANVRSVPARITRAVPGLEECNATVTVDDLGATTTGTVTTSDPAGFDAFPAAISATTSWEVSAVVDGGTDGGKVCNEATLKGESSSVSVIIGYRAVTNPDGSVTQEPIYYVFPCCLGLDLSAGACVDVNGQHGFVDGDYCTYTQGGYQGNGTPGQLLLGSWATVLGGTLAIGIEDAGGPMHDATWTDVAKLRTWLAGGGPSTALTADTLDATTTSGGTLAKQTATLALNVALNAAGVTDARYANFGDLTLCNLAEDTMIGSWILDAAQAAGLEGMPVSQVLADANAALGGAGLPSYVGSFGDLNQLVTELNESFDNCVVNGFAAAHLCTP